MDRGKNKTDEVSDIILWGNSHLMTQLVGKCVTGIAKMSTEKQNKTNLPGHPSVSTTKPRLRERFIFDEHSQNAAVRKPRRNFFMLVCT